ncbi:hypothetical protein OIU85_027354 [Salix viminalis]|uniref:Uncharacterized protein n=1 Tax=Salix viminalis TaxID=40686 RepID=A0A9Q0QHW3_SALVM|nr:hypothetical protein OIU85_027354 [Salix viminalis]
MLTQQQQFTMATAAGSGNGSHTILAKSHRSGSDGIHLPARGWGSHGQVQYIAPINDMANTKATTPTQAFPVAPPQPAGYYDLSSLAMYTKQGWIA